jgi:O-methyltransferase
VITGFQKLTREILFHTPLKRYFFPRYLYNFTPPQLCFLCQCIEETKYVAGSIVEVGCANGLTTVFLNKYMTCQNIEKTYNTIDTFSGFVVDDVHCEVSHRGKSEKLFKLFQVNKKKWFDWTMRVNDIKRVHSFEADINKFDIAALGSLSFILLDVDLYRPVKKALPELYALLSPGGIMIVDDCDPLHIRWDGANQAYEEFMKELRQDGQVMHGKLGIIRKLI